MATPYTVLLGQDDGADIVRIHHAQDAATEDPRGPVGVHLLPPPPLPETGQEGRMLRLHQEVEVGWIRRLRDPARMQGNWVMMLPPQEPLTHVVLEIREGGVF